MRACGREGGRAWLLCIHRRTIHTHTHSLPTSLTHTLTHSHSHTHIHTQYSATMIDTARSQAGRLRLHHLSYCPRLYMRYSTVYSISRNYLP